MSRLIDADKLIEAIENHDFGTIKAYGEHSQVAKILANVFIFAVEEVVKIVKTQPTTYDADKVIDEMEGCVFTVTDCDDGDFSAVELEEAIGIVKRGGIDEL